MSQIQLLNMKGHMHMAFLPDDRYFLFYTFRQDFFNQMYASYIRKGSRKKNIQTSEHQRSCRRKEKYLFLLLFPQHTL